MTFQSFRTPAETQQLRGFDAVTDRLRQQREREHAERNLRAWERHLHLTDTVDRTVEPFDRETHIAEMSRDVSPGAVIGTRFKWERGLVGLIRSLRGIS